MNFSKKLKFRIELFKTKILLRWEPFKLGWNNALATSISKKIESLWRTKMVNLFHREERLQRILNHKKK